MDRGLLPVWKHHVGEEALVTAQQGGGNERRRKTHGVSLAGRVGKAKRAHPGPWWARFALPTLRAASIASEPALADHTAKLVLDMNADDVVARLFGHKAECACARR